jgi:hypothetical protein
MSALDVPDVPDDVRARLAAQASARGQTLPEYLRDQLTVLAQGGRGAALLDRFEGRADGSRLTDQELVEEIDRFRTERDGH